MDDESTEKQEIRPNSMGDKLSVVALEVESKIPHLITPNTWVWKSVRNIDVERALDPEWLPMICDLLHSFDDLAGMFHDQLRRKSWLNAFLLAAGINQIVEDYLNPDPLLLSKAAKYLMSLPAPAGPNLSASAQAAAAGLAKIYEWLPATGRIISWQQKLEEICDQLAFVAFSQVSKPNDFESSLMTSSQNLIAQLDQLPLALRKEIIRIPSCFRSFDQQPSDYSRIIDEFSIHWPKRDKSIGVIGLRTSGSYLAPMAAAQLKARGYSKITSLTIRPGRNLPRYILETLRRLVNKESLILVCDDPPISGASLAKAGAILEDVGFPIQSIIMILQLFGETSSLPTPLQKYPSILLAWSEWSVQRHLDTNEIKNLLCEVCSFPYSILDVSQLPNFNGIEKRQHVHDNYRVRIQNTSTGDEFSRFVRISGVGLGYFAEHVLAVESKLPSYAAPVIMMRDGLLYQEIPDAVQPLTASTFATNSQLTNQLAGYIWRRALNLATCYDTSLRLDHRNAVWEVISNMLSTAFGRGWWMARIPLIDPIVKRIVQAKHPAIIDGDMSLRNWYFQDRPGTNLVKVNLAENDFSHNDLYSYDPVFDLAGLAVEIDAVNQADSLQNAYESISKMIISQEKWMLYQLVHVWDLQRRGVNTPEKIQRRMARVLQHYYAALYFAQPIEVGHGPLCALDIDGVLETNLLGFPSLSPAGARSLRALITHGYRVVLATGRSLEEVKERCSAYHLSGGVAEYGAVIYDHGTNQVVELLTKQERNLLDRLANRVSKEPSLSLDPEYQYALRVFRRDNNGKNIGLSQAVISELMNEVSSLSQLVPIRGVAQTDFMVRRVNKGLGLQEWAARFEEKGEIGDPTKIPGKKIAMVVGDSPSDISMLKIARMAFAPSHANQDVKNHTTHLISRPYQRGLEEAVYQAIGHQPGACPICRLPDLPDETKDIQKILALQENGRLDMFWKAFKLFLNRGA